jgi:phosphonopyruvate decarboxylase
MLLLIGWRAEPGVKDEPQHVTQGRIQEALLEALEVPHVVLGADEPEPDAVLAGMAEAFGRDPRPRAILIRRDTFAPYVRQRTEDEPAALTRATAIESLLPQLGDVVLVSTTGMSSREVFDYRERHGEPHDRDFLTVGSMGHASQIALGIAQRRPDEQVICLDGDGALIMHMGSLAIIGSQAPSNLGHIVINNGAHDSVGGQATAARQIDIPAIALACGYRSARSVGAVEEVAVALGALRGSRGPWLLEVRVASEAHTAAGRPTTSPAENKAAFMKALGVGEG